MTQKRISRLPGFYKKTLLQRRDEVAKWTQSRDLSLFDSGGLSDALCDTMVENAVGRFSLPLGIATNFTINGIDTLVPMVTEEPSVIAAASNAARMIRDGGGFTAEADLAIAVAQVELLFPAPDGEVRIRAATRRIMEMADSTQPDLISRGGGMREVEIRPAVGNANRMVVHLVVDCLDAMGANTVNTMAETVTPLLCELSGASAGLRILTNLADRRLAKATCRIPVNALSREDFPGIYVAEGVAKASAFASADPYRATTHNKGIFNGIDAVLLATGNDWRAVAAGGHAFAAKSGVYSPLCTWMVENDHLLGAIEMPMAVGIVGGASKIHPAAVKCIEIAGVTTGRELAIVAVCAGMASNLAALAALSCEGIQSGHMKLHLKKSL